MDIGIIEIAVIIIMGVGGFLYNLIKGRLNELKAEIKEVKKECHEKVGKLEREHSQKMEKVFTLIRELTEKVNDIRVDVRAIRKNGH